MRPERPPTVLDFARGETFSQTRWRSLEVPAAGKPAVDPYTFPRTARCGARGEGADGDVRLGWRRLAGCVGLAGRGAPTASTRPRRVSAQLDRTGRARPPGRAGDRSRYPSIRRAQPAAVRGPQPDRAGGPQ